jgi:hypothetical protein
VRHHCLEAEATLRRDAFIAPAIRDLLRAGDTRLVRTFELARDVVRVDVVLPAPFGPATINTNGCGKADSSRTSGHGLARTGLLNAGVVHGQRLDRAKVFDPSVRMNAQPPSAARTSYSMSV